MTTDTNDQERQTARAGAPRKAVSQANETGDADRTFSIGELAHEFDITTRTIRFYEARGLISPQRSGTNRIYSRRDRARLKLILRGKNLGFSLEDIAEYLKLYDVDPSQRAQTELLVGKVDAAIADLEAKRSDIERALRDLTEIRTKCAEFLRAMSAE
ncbi:MAG: MerR family transcriptional regulator [Hyphomicrobiaceae bacterium]